MRSVITGIMMVVGMLLTQIGQAYPALSGPTGNGALPTAETAGPGRIQLAADYLANEDGVVPLRLLVGLGCPFEVGVTYVAGDQVIDDTTIMLDGAAIDEFLLSDTFGVNAKYVTPLRISDAPVAIGALYYSGNLRATVLDEFSNTATETLGDQTVTQVYLVATKAFTPCDAIAIVRGTLGLNWTRIARDFDDEVCIPFVTEDDDDSAFRFYVAADVSVLDLFTLAAEYQTKAGDLETDTLWSIVGRYAFSPSLSGQLGVTDAAGVLGTPETSLFLGLNYTFGAKY